MGEQGSSISLIYKIRNGNVTQRQNNTPLTLTESFAYDADNRVTCAALASTCSASTFIYDSGSAGPGNITSQTGVGTYSYPVAGQPRPHAVSSISGTVNGPFSYDGNGNMTARESAGQNIYWFTYNYPSSIISGSEEVQFLYGPDRQRWKQIYTGSSGTETTYYVGSGVQPAPAQLEVVYIGGNPIYRHYIYAGSEPIAVYSRASTGNTMSYLLEDHQGGVSAITSNTGAADIDESFSAFGQRRNPTTWSGPPTTSDLNTIAGYSRQGYTFQTWLGQSMGLNHMNGRVQDAVLGRLLSADPYVPDPTNAQSYNRYSYVNNNPLTMVDTSGFCGITFVFNPGSDGEYDGEDIEVTGSTYNATFDFSDCFTAPSTHGPVAPNKSPPGVPKSAPAIVAPPTFTIPAAQSQAPAQPQTPCPSSVSNNSSHQNNIKLGGAVGFSAFAITGIFVAINIVGFPEAEMIELTAAGSLTAGGGYTATALAGEPLGTMAVGAATGAGYGLVVGSGVGAAIPSAGCPVGPQ
jgi:RHS repeat-associated protein